MIRGNSQSFNADNQLTAETYDGEGNRTSYDGGTVLYDANDLPTSVPGSGGATPFTQTFTSEGERAWKLPSGGSKTYYLYDNGAVLLELSSTGSPVNTYAYGPSGLLERYQHTNVGVPYVMYLYDPNGNPVHRVRSIDPSTSSGAAVFVQDTAIYDSQGLLHADIDTLTGGFNSGHLDPIGYKGELGNYTDLETQRSVSGLYTALSGPGGTLYYDPLSGVAMARSQAASANEYANNLAPVEHALHEGFVGVAGIVGYSAGPIGSALAAGAIDAEITYLEGNDAKTSLIHGGVTAGSALLLGKAGEIVGGPLIRYVAGRLTPEAASAVAGVNCFVAGTPVQMADGSTKPIEQVKVGDYVQSRDPKTGIDTVRVVTQTYQHHADQLLVLTLVDKTTGQSETFTCTPFHRFWVMGMGFVEAQSLGIGTQIVTRAGPCLILTEANPAVDQTSGQEVGDEVYNFTVDVDHTYFVGNLGSGVWVHNTSISLQQVTDEIADAHFFGRAGRRFQTIAVARTAENELVVASNGAKSNPLARAYLSKTQQEVAEKYGIKHYAKGARYGNRHAEQNVIGWIEEKLNTKATEIAASNHLCPQCTEYAVGTKGVYSHTPFVQSGK